MSKRTSQGAKHPQPTRENVEAVIRQLVPAEVLADLAVLRAEEDLLLGESDDLIFSHLLTR